MGICRKERMIVKGQLIKWKGNVPILMAFGMEIILLIQYLWGYTEIGLKSGTKITPCVLFLLFQDGTIGVNLAKVMVYLGAVLILSEAPFMDEVSPYVIMRSKRSAWWKGECLYIWLATFLYMAFLVIISILIVLPTVTWNGLWGSTIAHILKNSNIPISTEIVKVFYPSATLGMTFLSGWISMVFLGHLAYAVSLSTNKKILGLLAMIFFVLLDPVVKWLGFGMDNQWMFRFSPISWSSIANWKMVNSQAPMEIPYIVGVYTALIIGCMIIIAWASKRKQIEVISLQ